MIQHYHLACQFPNIFDSGSKIKRQKFFFDLLLGLALLSLISVASDEISCSLASVDPNWVKPATGGF